MSSWRFKDKVGSLITRVEISFVYRFSVRHRLKVKRSCAIESSRVLTKRLEDPDVRVSDSVIPGQPFDEVLFGGNAYMEFL